MKKLMSAAFAIAMISSLVACVPRTSTPTIPGSAAAPAVATPTQN